MGYRYIYLLLTGVFLLLIPLWAQQQETLHGITAIEAAAGAGKTDEATAMLESDIRIWSERNNTDTLIAYLPLKARLVKMKNGAGASADAVYQYLEMLSAKNMNALQTVTAWHNAAIFFETGYELPEAYKAMSRALAYAETLDKDRQRYAAECEYNLGVFAYKMGNVAVSEKHHRRSLALKSADPAVKAEQWYYSCNAMGSILWHASRYDSARYYYSEALEAMKKMPKHPVNQYYRPALVKNNMVAIYREEGKMSEALAMAYEVIEDYRNFLRIPGDEEGKRQYAEEGWCGAIDNLAGIYRHMGNYRKAEDLLLYAYRKKQQLSATEDNPGTAISEILLGQFYSKKRNFGKAETFLQKGLAGLKKTRGDYIFWEADALHSLAVLYEQTDRTMEAAGSYEKAEALYEKAYGGSYDDMYMDFLRNQSSFYARQNRRSEAFRTAGKTGIYLKSAGAENTTQGFRHLLNLAEIHYQTSHYRQAIRYSERAMAHLDRMYRSGNSFLDSVQAEMHQPRAILIQCKSAYALQAKKDSVFLTSIYRRLEAALAILERRKMLIDDQDDINTLMEQHKELTGFFSRIALDLYDKSSGLNYLEEFVNIRENALYGRIRSRLNKEKAIRFSRVPEAVLADEQKLKAALLQALEPVAGSSDQMDVYRRSVNAWEEYLDKIKRDYPQYYQLRYATLFHSLPQLHQLIPDSTTLVRYYMTDTSLVALVADKHRKKLFRLSVPGLEENIHAMHQYSMDASRLLPVLYELYRMLWQPLEGAIHTQKVMVIPDGALYRISMDMLPVELPDDFSQLKDKSLLARHAFSHHYSLFMLEAVEQQRHMRNNYAVFAPGFSDELKERYKGTIKDSMHLDRKYLTMLPQPANAGMAREIKRIIGGQLFLDASSTAQTFRDQADNHKIIHIATHAEYNNTLPEQSGLYFAKDAKGGDNNFFSLNDIYGCTMNAELLLLTACESGRPGYQDGEGLVSLAHAFNYAGSETILTALWKIDEQASAAISKMFIRNIKNGLPSDEALRQAKLTYLSVHEGRLLAPAYWSGLVLLGRAATIELDDDSFSHLWWLIPGGGVLILMMVLLIAFQKRK